MEDENKVRSVIVCLGFVLILALVFGVGFFIYNKVMVSKNNDNFSSFLLKDGYSDDGDIYTKDVLDDDKEISYSFNKSDSIFSKDIFSKDSNEVSISLSYEDGVIESSLTIYGTNLSGIYGSTLQTGIYDGEFSCKIIIDDNFGSKCDVLREETLNFLDELNDLFDKSGCDSSFIK